MRITLLFKSYGPYHLARLDALSRVHEVLPVEFHAVDTDYDWRVGALKREMRVRTLSDFGADQGARLRALRAELDRFRPDAVAIPGYWEADALAAARLCRRLGIACILMSDTHQGTARPSIVRTSLKRHLLGLFDAALVAGTPHAEYLASLGFDWGRIALGYDVVDNRHFASTYTVSATSLKLPARYFFCCTRLVEKKNISGLIDAFALYRQRMTPEAWDLVIAGDGPLRGELLRQILERQIGHSVHLIGKVDYADLPLMYQRAGAFVLPSLREEWGLVVNEAMAAGLPVLISRGAGCYRDLVRDRLNGYTFAPNDSERFTGLLQTIAHCPASQRARMGDASRRIIRRWDLQRFVTGMSEAATMAFAHQRSARPVAARAIALALSFRQSI